MALKLVRTCGADLEDSLLVFPGFGTLVNVGAVLAGSGLGVLLGHRLPLRTRNTVTDALGLVTLLIGALSAISVTSTRLSAVVGTHAPVLIVLGAMLIGGIVGSLIDIEARLEGFGGWLRQRLGRRRPTRSLESIASAGSGIAPNEVEIGTDAEVNRQQRFIEGFVTASLVFCVGPLTIIGSLSDGLGLGSDQLIVKAVLDGFASIAFAASLGIGVMASAVSLVLIQGSLTVVGLLLGSFLPPAHLDALTAVGGLLLLGVGMRLLALKQVPVGNLLPALVVAPLLVQLVAVLR